MSFPRYPTYKDSGVEWLVDMPEEWDIGQSRRLFNQRKTRSQPLAPQLAVSQKYGVIQQDVFIDLE